MVEEEGKDWSFDRRTRWEMIEHIVESDGGWIPKEEVEGKVEWACSVRYITSLEMGRSRATDIS